MSILVQVRVRSLLHFTLFFMSMS